MVHKTELFQLFTFFKHPIVRGFMRNDLPTRIGNDHQIPSILLSAPSILEEFIVVESNLSSTKRVVVASFLLGGNEGSFPPIQQGIVVAVPFFSNREKLDLQLVGVGTGRSLPNLGGSAAPPAPYPAR